MNRWITLSVLVVCFSLASCATSVAPTGTSNTPPAIAPSPPVVATEEATSVPPIASPLPLASPTQELAPTQESAGPVITDPTLARLVGEAQADLAQRSGIAASSVTVKSAEPVEWRDSSLGCPVEGQMYMQVITPGYKIVLEAGGQEYNYHASDSQVVFCDQ